MNHPSDPRCGSQSMRRPSQAGRHLALARDRFRTADPSRFQQGPAAATSPFPRHRRESWWCVGHQCSPSSVQRRESGTSDRRQTQLCTHNAQQHRINHRLRRSWLRKPLLDSNLASSPVIGSSVIGHRPPSSSSALVCPHDEPAMSQRAPVAAATLQQSLPAPTGSSRRSEKACAAVAQTQRSKAAQVACHGALSASPRLRFARTSTHLSALCFVVSAHPSS